MTRRPQNRHSAWPHVPEGLVALGSVGGSSAAGVVLSLALLTATACNSDLDAGGNVNNDLLPLDQHSPVILDNDNWADNWAGENAVLLANTGAMRLVGLIVNASRYWKDLGANLAGWNSLIDAARGSGLKIVPEITVGAVNTTLKVPGDRIIDHTTPLYTDGAKLIVRLSQQLYLPEQPVLVITGSQLTNLADAYLIDRSVVDRVIVVSSLGSHNDPTTVMTGPNGDLDPWADWIVAQRFRYVQIAVLYDQTADVTDADVPKLPDNTFGWWMRDKRPKLSNFNTAADQLAVLAAGLPKFATEVQRSAPASSAVFNSPPGQGPQLVPNSTGDAWVVTQVEASLARQHLWDMLRQSFPR
jgi:hypothetical protein